MSTGIGGRLRSARTTRAWLTRGLSPSAQLAELWHFPLPAFRGTSDGTSTDTAFNVDGATRVDPSFAPYTAPFTSEPWAKLAGGLGHGYGLWWVVRIEGIPTLFLEAMADAIAPLGYDLDATLVIDRSARLGSVIDGESHIAKGFDLELRLLDSPAVRTYMRRPARFTTLAEDSPADPRTTLAVQDGRPWADLDECYIGPSCLPLEAATANTMFLENTIVGRYTDLYGRVRSFKRGTLVTDGPYNWQQRRVELYAVMMDPSGRYVQTHADGTHILARSNMRWAGYIAERPVRDGTEWVMTVRDQVRRIADPIGVSASGTAKWTPDDDDSLVAVPTTMTFFVEFELPSDTYVSANVAPFAAMSGMARASELRQAVVDALTAASTIGTLSPDVPGVLGFFWRPRTHETVPPQVMWDLFVRFNPDTGDTFSTVVSVGTNMPGTAGFMAGLLGAGLEERCSDSHPAIVETWLSIWQLRAIHGAALAVTLDKGDSSQLPPSGVVVLEASGVTDYAQYTSFTVDEDNSSVVHLVLAPGDRPVGQTAIDLLAPEAPSVSVRFLWQDTGKLADMLRRALASSGDGVLGVWDTLPKGQGLALPAVDEQSFEAVFGALADFDFQIAADSGSSLAELFEGLFRLSRRALMTRCRPDGRACEIAAVDIGSVDTGVPVATITADMLVTTQGRRPVRVKRAFAAPQSIAATCRTIPVGETPEGEGVITFKDEHLTDWTGTRWELDIHGLAREDLLVIGEGWALSWFRAGETRQIVEIDLPPTVDAQGGDVVAIDLPDAALWDYARGDLGYTGLARVLGAVMDPTTAIVTLYVALDGIATGGPMSPSLEIVAVNGGGTTPTSIDVPEAYYALLTRARGDASTWKVLGYWPGYDSGRAEYSVTDVTLTGGVARLTVVAYPSPAVDLTTSFRLTWPVATECTDEQGVHLHNTDTTQWS